MILAEVIEVLTVMWVCLPICMRVPARITNSMAIKFEQTLGDSGKQGSLVGCSPWGRQELDLT